MKDFTNLSSCAVLNAYMKLDSVKTKKGTADISGKTLCSVGFTPEAIGVIEGIDESQLYSVPNAAYANLFKKMYNTVDSAYTNDLVKNFIFNGRAGTDMLFFKAVQSYKADNRLKDVKSILIVPSEDWYTGLTEGKSILLNKWESPMGRSKGVIFTADDAKEMVSKADVLIPLRECIPTPSDSLTDDTLRCIDFMLACSHTVYNVYENIDWNKSTDKYASYTISKAEHMHKSDNALINNINTTGQNIAKPESQCVIETESSSEVKSTTEITAVKSVEVRNTLVTLTDEEKVVRMKNIVKEKTGRLLFPCSYEFFGTKDKKTNQVLTKRDQNLINKIGEIINGTKVKYSLIVNSPGKVNIKKPEDIQNKRLAPSWNTLEIYNKRSGNNDKWREAYVPAFCKDIAGFNEHSVTKAHEALADIMQLLVDATGSVSTLLFCSCKNGSTCHRSIVKYFSMHMLHWFVNSIHISDTVCYNESHDEFVNALRNTLQSVTTVEKFRDTLIDAIYFGNGNIAHKDVSPTMNSLTLIGKSGNPVEIADNNDILFLLYNYYYRKTTGFDIFKFTGTDRITELYNTLKENIMGIAKAVSMTINKREISDMAKTSIDFDDIQNILNTVGYCRCNKNSAVNINKGKTYYVSGNRPKVLSPDDNKAYSSSYYSEIIKDMVADVLDMYSRGFDTVITGGAQGIDQVYAWSALKVREAIKAYNAENPDNTVPEFTVKIYKTCDDPASMWYISKKAARELYNCSESDKKSMTKKEYQVLTAEQKKSLNQSESIFSSYMYWKLEETCTENWKKPENAVSCGIEWDGKKDVWSAKNRDNMMRNASCALVAFRRAVVECGTTSNIYEAESKGLKVRSYLLKEDQISFRINGSDNISKGYKPIIEESVIEKIVPFIKFKS